MLEQDFEKLLAAYFEEELSEESLISFGEAVGRNPAYRRRYQRELRLHSLMREAAQVILQDDGQPLEKAAAGKVIHRFTWLKVAAVLLLSGIMAQVFWAHRDQAEIVGHLVHVSDSEGLKLWRQDKLLSVGHQTALEAGDRMVTGPQAKASFKLHGVGVLNMRSATELEIFPEGGAVAVAVNQGLVMVEAEERQAGTPPALFSTPKAEVEVMGTVFGLEVNAAATRVMVHEGLVKFSDRSSERSVEVEAGQYSENGGDQPQVREQAELEDGALLPGQFRLLPSEDAHSDYDEFFDDIYLKVEHGRRTSLLKFEVPEGGEILAAKIRITQSVDPGEGSLRVWEGSHSDWSERTLSAETMPSAVRRIAERSGWVGLDQAIELDVSSLVREAGAYTVLLSLEDEDSNDIWFGSKESATPPELILTRQAE